MLKKLDDFNEVIDYLKRRGFKNINEMESYLKKNGFGVKFLNFYTDSEESHYAFKVTFHGNQVYMMETIILGETTFGTLKKLMGLADAIYFG